MTARALQAVATASGDKTVRLWSLADGACLRTFEGHTASALRCCFLSAGTQVPYKCPISALQLPYKCPRLSR